MPQGCLQLLSTSQLSPNTRARPPQHLLPTQSSSLIFQQLYLLASFYFRALATQFGLLLLQTDSQTRPKGSSVLPLLLQSQEGLMMTRAALTVFDAPGLLTLENVHV